MISRINVYKDSEKTVNNKSVLKIYLVILTAIAAIWFVIVAICCITYLRCFENRLFVAKFANGYILPV